MLSTKKVTHYAIVKNLDWRGITKYPLSLSMYTDYRLAKNDRHIWD